MGYSDIIYVQRTHFKHIKYICSYTSNIDIEVRQFISLTYAFLWLATASDSKDIWYCKMDDTGIYEN